MGFKEPTPIQAQVIPLALAGQDVIGCAQTGTGKTAAFLIPSLTKMLQDEESQTLILVPTRELADQVFRVIRELTQFLPQFRTVLLMGGVPISKQFRLLRAPYRFVVATPGRLNDHLKRGSIELHFVQHLVIDEADRLLDMGFAPQLGTILNYLPDTRQSSMFTATLDDNVRRLSAKYLKNPTTIRTADASQFKLSIEQRTVRVPKVSDKSRALLEEIRRSSSSVLVFARTQINVDRIARFLQDSGVDANQIHGGRTQGQRTWALRGFKNGEYRVLVATDIASRGIDIDRVGLVVNFEMPEDPDDYIHRIGRTGRAEKQGVAVNLLSPDDEDLWKRIVHREKGWQPREKKTTSAPSSDKPRHACRAPHKAKAEESSRKSSAPRRLKGDRPSLPGAEGGSRTGKPPAPKAMSRKQSLFTQNLKSEKRRPKQR